MNAPTHALLLDPEMLERGRWRVGGKLLRTVYLQRGPEPADTDPLIGIMETAVLARLVVDDHNARRPR